MVLQFLVVLPVDFVDSRHGLHALYVFYPFQIFPVWKILWPKKERKRRRGVNTAVEALVAAAERL